MSTSYGPVEGSVQAGDRRTDFFAFRSIPYGKAPIGPLRFKDPQTPEPWTRPFDATRSGPVPYGMDLFLSDLEPLASEDCLRLNVFTKSV